MISLHQIIDRAQPFLTKRDLTLIALGLPTVLACKHVFDVYRAISPAPRRKIIELDSIPDDLEESSTLKEHVNASSHVALRDSRYIDLDLPVGMTDELILARFVEGFFGGSVFRMERGLLRLFRMDLVNYSGEWEYAMPSNQPINLASTPALRCTNQGMEYSPTTFKLSTSTAISPLWRIHGGRSAHRRSTDISRELPWGIH
jgi:hypothetical protein